MILHQVSAAGDRNFGYLIADPVSRICAVIDPSGVPDQFIRLIKTDGLTPRYVICTHHHSDHTTGARELKLYYDIPIAMHRSAPAPHDLALDDGQELELGRLSLRVIHTPGHTEDSICLYLAGAVFTGDTLFVGKVGGTDLGTGALNQYESLLDKLLTLPEDTAVYPGHNYGLKPVSTLLDEKKQNPFLLQPDFEHFVELKRNWAAYKARHGIQ